MIITLNLNHKHYEWDITPSETLLEVLRRNGLFSVKSGGCRHGECGACTVLFDGKPINACNILAAQADGHRVQTVESMGEHPEKGWKTSLGLHPIQQAMVGSEIPA
jgi:putative selenate reductase molybdopterin-binding subunit